MKRIYGIIGAVFLAGFFAFYLFSSGVNVPSYSVNGVDDGVNYKNTVCYSTTGDFEGRLTPAHNNIGEFVGCDHNVVYNSGLDATIQGLFNDTNSGFFRNLTLCNSSAGGNCGTPVAGATEQFIAMANTCGLFSVTATRVGNGTGGINLTNTFTSTCDSQSTNVSKIQNATGYNFSSNSFTATTLNSNDQLSINYSIRIS